MNRPTPEEVIGVVFLIGKTIDAELIDCKDCGSCLKHYRLSNGWEIKIFDECCGEWDYLQAVKRPREDWIDLYDDEHTEYYEPVQNHLSPDEHNLKELRLS